MTPRFCEFLLVKIEVRYEKWVTHESLQKVRLYRLIIEIIDYMLEIIN